VSYHDATITVIVCSICLSVCLSVTFVDHMKTVQYNDMNKMNITGFTSWYIDHSGFSWSELFSPKEGIKVGCILFKRMIFDH